ncbi:hypothetical protein [Chitinophaga arvensicola]|uniref:Uncharacterized protein n=1 Tax=Chitinophaga arvensicola TaxID=29529 RepID=A0A1I0S7N5_9BACT|nr:hypothetical protein [Chitinophaga arvensicola]SEW51653.1 hypothetical protein SAMN04488122_4417 [Chitinophaga arvensicola]
MHNLLLPLIVEIQANPLLIATIVVAAAAVAVNGKMPTITLVSTASIMITIIVSKADFH